LDQAAPALRVPGNACAMLWRRRGPFWQPWPPSHRRAAAPALDDAAPTAIHSYPQAVYK